MPKKVLIMGAGYSGIEAALTLQKGKKKDEMDITLIDKNSYHTLLTELHEVAGNRISEDGVIVPLREIFKYTDVRIVKDKINKIDFKSNKLISESNEYTFDYLIIAAGSEPNFFNIPGMEEHCFPLWSLSDAINIRERIKNCFIAASQEKDFDKRSRMLTFVVGGGGYTGVEMVGELALWLKSLCEEYRIPRNDVRLVLVEALSTILSSLKEKNINKSMSYLTKKLKVEVLTNTVISKLSSDSVEFKDGTKMPTNTLIWTAGVKASCIAEEVDIGQGKFCRIKVDEYTQTQYKNVFAVGDISAFISEGSTLPTLVEGALQTGKAAAKNILSDIRGMEKQILKPNLHGVMVSIGSYFAVSDLMGKQLSSLLSILMKYLVNIHYLFGIGGFELVFKYIKHEFLYKKQKKIILEKHISMTTPNFWLVPIRLFLGYSWLMEGIKKINEGWLTNAVLTGIKTTSANVVDAATSASTAVAPVVADAVSSASEAGATAPGAISNAFSIISAHTPSWYAWIANTIVIPNALVFQIIIVLSEIALGLAFISGTFTFIAAIASIGLNLNFLLSTGMYPYDYWYFAAALCMFGGAGRAFGIDYYLIPYLMRQWRYFVRNRKIKLWLFS